MADKEFEVGGELGLPEWGLLKARVSARYKATWISRRRDLVDKVTERTDLTPEEFAERVISDEHLGDVLLAASDRAALVGDRAYRDALAGLVAAACDQALISEADYLLTQILKLDPVHLRVFFALFTFSAWSDAAKIEETGPNEATFAEPSLIEATEVADLLNLDLDLTQSLIAQLSNGGWVTTEVKVTNWGFGAIQRIFPALEEVSKKRRRPLHDSDLWTPQRPG